MRRVADATAAAIALAVVACFVLRAWRPIHFPFPLDYAEGPLLEQARLLGAGENIYRARITDYPFTVANYPPLFPALLALLGRVFGLGYGLGRLVTGTAALLCAAFVGLLAKKLTEDKLAAWVAVAAFLASPYVVFWSALVRIDFVALALSLGALFVVLPRPGRPWQMKRAVGAGVLVALAVLTRQSHLLAGPLAIGGALAVASVRRAIVFFGVFGAVLVSVVLGLEVVTHGGFLFHTVRANFNAFSWPLLEYFLGDMVQASPVLLLGAGVSAVALVRQRGPGSRQGELSGALLATLYLVGATLSALTVGKIGSHVNYLLELTAALAIFAGVTFAWARRTPRLVVSIAVAGLVLLQVLWLESRALFRPSGLELKLSLSDQYAKLQRVLEREEGLVLADETMGMLVLSRHPILLSPFEFTQLVHEGAWEQEKVVGDIRARRFALILINDGPATPARWTRERWSPEMLAAIHEGYEPTGGLALATLYRPRPALAP